ncbi:MAG: hypothetical protein DI586_05950 [Micavibrio aeruginosavorus]|uniref:Potassium channel domain-containing protein n=1 Tax=Micavibrio aeruginosavorus TaxID=349221 RepID=A0A2W5FIH0_9BACT|nr:MAG: hypothetical protein DI586_05950 [Micavibrio aeruginosavorus]
MIGITVAMHAVCLDFIIHRARMAAVFARKHGHFAWKPLLSGIIVISVFAIHVVQIWIWAILYLAMDSVSLHTLSDALYFSTVTFTTVGYGDIVLGPEIRMLSAIEAANGFLLFGWTAAFIFEVISHLYRRETDYL